MRSPRCARPPGDRIGVADALQADLASPNSDCRPLSRLGPDVVRPQIIGGEIPTSNHKSADLDVVFEPREAPSE